AMLFAGGKAPAGAVSAGVFSLTQEALKGMALTTKLKLGAALVLGAGLLLAAVGGGIVCRRGGAPPAAAAGQGDRRAEDPAAVDARQLQGEWRVVGLEWDGKKDPAYTVMSARWLFHFRGGEITSKGDEGGWEGRQQFTLHVTRSPKAIDITWLEGRAKGQTAAGIYSLEGDLLRLCL